MVVQIIRAADGAAFRKPYKLPQKVSPAKPHKALKVQSNSSPGTAQHLFCRDEEVPQYWLDSSLLDLNAEGLDDWTVFADPQLTSSEEGSSDQDGTCHPSMSLPLEPHKVHHPSQSWKIDCHEGKPAQRPFAKSVSDSSYSSITLNAVAHHPDSSTDLLKKSSSMAPNLQEEPEGCLEYSPKSFTDMLTAPPADGIRGLPSSPPVPDSVFQEMFTQNSSGMAPTAVPDSPQPSGAKEGATPELDMQLGNLSATIQKLHKDAKRFQAEATRAQQEVVHMSDALQLQQQRLDCQAREALRAAMGLENCASSIVSAVKQGAEGQSPGCMPHSIQGDMTKCLSVLKESLWQLLVLATNVEDPAK